MTYMKVRNNKKIYENYQLDKEIQGSEEKYYFIFKQDGKKSLLLINNKVPLLKDINQIIKEDLIKNNIYIGEFYKHDAYVVELNSENKEIDKLIEEENNEFVELMEVYDINEEIYLIAGRASQIIDWENNHKYCGRCGAKTYTSNIERAKICPECGFMSFTRISPAIITSIIKEEKNEEGEIENKILMAKHSYYKDIDYSLIAGFMEAGETIEEAVEREVEEEIGLKVKDLEYFGSQSWPFPNSLMIGVICKYDSGEINVDGKEIVEAKWFGKNEIYFPKYHSSIAAKLIKNFIDNY